MVESCSPNLKGLFCDSPISTCQRLKTTSLSAIDTSITNGFAGSQGPSGRAACTVAWISWRAFSYSRPPSKLAAFQVTWYMGPSNTPSVLSPESNRPTKCCASFLLVRGTRCNKLSFTLGWISLCVPNHWIPKNFTEVEGLWILVGFFSYPLMFVCVTNKSKSSCYLLLTWSNQHAINILDQCAIFYGRNTWSSSFWAKL